MFQLRTKSHTHGKGIERIKTSVNTSEQACARYIISVLMQAPGVNPKLQLSEIGKHCSRFAVKTAIVHATVKPVITQETTENVFVEKILVQRLAYRFILS